MKELSAQIQTMPASQDGAGTRKNRFSVSRTAGTMPIYKPRDVSASYAPKGAEADIPKTGFGPEAPSFKDVIDIINPLQHLPLVSNLYRELTGDEISSPARFIGASLYGGPIGGALALTDIAIKEQTGSSVSEKALNLVRNDTENFSSPLTIAKRHQAAPRMAGTIPVWNGGASANTRFEAMLAGISNTYNHIS